MARVPTATREGAPAHQREAFDEMVKQRGEIPTHGPSSVMINAPEMLVKGEVLREYLRGDLCSLPANVRELAMIIAARENDCRYIWNAHSGLARAAGIGDDLVDNLRDKKPLPEMTPQVAAVVNYGQEYFRTHRVSHATFDAALAQFGARGLTELTTLMGYYAMLAFNVNAFEVNLPPNTTEKLLPV